MVEQAFSRMRLRSPVPSKAACKRQFTPAGSPVRVKASLFLLSFTLAVSVAQPAARGADSQPVNTTQLVAWLTGGVSGARLARLVEERGLATLPTHAELHQVEAA